MSKPITELWQEWREGRFVPANERQRLILELWTAFLDADAFSYDCVTTTPDMLEKLWEKA